jgi:Capsule polysaccharide biosynthesis protein
MFTPGPTYPNTLLGRLRRLGSALARDDRLIDRVVSPIRRPIDRAWNAHAGRLRELAELGDNVNRTRPPTGDGKRVLVLSLRMWAHHAACESVIAHALRLRGADVTLVTCGGGLPICEVGWGRRTAPRPCDRCAHFTDRVARAGTFHQIRLAGAFPWGSSPRKAPSRLDAGLMLSPSDAAFSSTAWFTKSGNPSRTPNGAAVERDFEVSVGAVETAFSEILDRFRPDVVFALNGLFAAERTVRAVAADRGVRVVTYEKAPRKDTLLFGEDDAAPAMVTDALAVDQRSRPLTESQSAALDALLAGRVSGASSHERYFDEPLEHEGEAVRRSLGIPQGTRVISAFTNLAWDTALLGRDVAYESQFEWLTHAVRVVATHKDAVLVIRAHPAESRWGTAQPVEAELSARIGALPDNVLLVSPDRSLSSYGLLAITDLVLCYTTTVGLEAAVRGIPVAVAGTPHYRSRGFTIDLDSPDDLERAIAEAHEMSTEEVELARRYAFAFFFRLMIPFKHVQTVGDRLTGVTASAEDLLPGRDPYLDFVCDRILEGGDFFLPPGLAVPGK